MIPILRDMAHQMPSEYVFAAFIALTATTFTLLLLSGVKREKLTAKQSFLILLFAFFFTAFVFTSVLGYQVVKQALSAKAAANAARSDALKSVEKLQDEKQWLSTQLTAKTASSSNQGDEIRVLEDTFRVLAPLVAQGIPFNKKWVEDVSTLATTPSRAGQTELLRETISQSRSAVAADANLQKTYSEMLREVATIALAHERWKESIGYLRELLQLPGHSGDLDALAKLLDALEGDGVKSSETVAIRNKLQVAGDTNLNWRLVWTKELMKDAASENDAKKAIEYGNVVIQLAQQLGRNRDRMLCQLELAGIFAVQHDAASARTLVDECAVVTSSSDAELLSAYAESRGLIALEENDLKLALSFFEVQERLESKLDRTRPRIEALCNVAATEIKLGTQNKAEQIVAEAEQLVGKNGVNGDAAERVQRLRQKLSPLAS